MHKEHSEAFAIRAPKALALGEAHQGRRAFEFLPFGLAQPIEEAKMGAKEGILAFIEHGNSVMSAAAAGRKMHCRRTRPYRKHTTFSPRRECRGLFPQGLALAGSRPPRSYRFILSLSSGIV